MGRRHARRRRRRRGPCSASRPCSPTSACPTAAVLNYDQWDGYAPARDRLLAAAAPVAGRIVVLTGDIHLAGVGVLPGLGAEFVTTSISSRRRPPAGGAADPRLVRRHRRRRAGPPRLHPPHRHADDAGPPSTASSTTSRDPASAVVDVAHVRRRRRPPATPSPSPDGDRSPSSRRGRRPVRSSHGTPGRRRRPARTRSPRRARRRPAASATPPARSTTGARLAPRGAARTPTEFRRRLDGPPRAAACATSPASSTTSPRRSASRPPSSGPPAPAAGAAAHGGGADAPPARRRRRRRQRLAGLARGLAGSARSCRRDRSTCTAAPDSPWTQQGQGYDAGPRRDPDDATTTRTTPPTGAPDIPGVLLSIQDRTTGSEATPSSTSSAPTAPAARCTAAACRPTASSSTCVGDGTVWVYDRAADRRRTAGWRRADRCTSTAAYRPSSFSTIHDGRLLRRRVPQRRRRGSLHSYDARPGGSLSRWPRRGPDAAQQPGRRRPRRRASCSPSRTARTTRATCCTSRSGPARRRRSVSCRRSRRGSTSSATSSTSRRRRAATSSTCPARRVGDRRVRRSADFGLAAVRPSGRRGRASMAAATTNLGGHDDDAGHRLPGGPTSRCSTTRSAPTSPGPSPPTATSRRSSPATRACGGRTTSSASASTAAPGACSRSAWRPATGSGCGARTTPSGRCCSTPRPRSA